jgi:hypothetical protein
MWGCTKYINGITYIPYIRTSGKILPTDGIHDIYVSDARGLEESLVQEALIELKGQWIGKPYSDWCK